MAAITTYQFEEGTVLRAVLLAGEPWFVAKDLCQAFGSANKNIRLELQRGNLDDSQIRTFMLPGQKGRPSLLVSESGLYTFILSSDRGHAVDFRRHVVEQVLPSIRKSGIYIAVDDASTELTTGAWLGMQAHLPHPLPVQSASSRINVQNWQTERRQIAKNGQPLRLAYLAVEFDDASLEQHYGAKFFHGARRTIEARLRRALRQTDVVRRLGPNAGFRVLLAMQDGHHFLSLVGRRVVSALEPALEVQGQSLQVATRVRGRFGPDPLVTDPSRLQHKLMDTIGRNELFAVNEAWDQF